MHHFTNKILLFNFISVFCSKDLVHRTAKMGLNGFSIMEFVINHGYPIEIHENIQTEDGYLLDMFRIPHGKQNGGFLNGPRPVIFLMHGLLGSAENWVISGPERGLAFSLADRGYDVWMGNARGSIHSRKHVALSPHRREFWHFSWHEIGVYDLPAKINYIVRKTSQMDMVYIGHSQGTTCFMVMASEKPNYNAHIKVMIAMAPVGYMSNIPHPSAKFLPLFAREASYISNIIGYGQFLPNNEILNLAGQAICREKAMFQEICANILFLAAGYDSEQLERSMLPLIGQTTPDGASTKQFYHYGQSIRTGEFRQYDYGLFTNIIMYRSVLPPLYNLSLITTPMCLFHASNDWLVSTEDVRKLSGQLTNVAMDYLIPHEAFNHLDFLFAKDVVSLVHVKVYEVIEKYIVI